MVPFAGWEMPVWYTMIGASGGTLGSQFVDVSHKVYQRKGPKRGLLDSVFTTTSRPGVGRSHCSF
jgi:hypothetical protein